MIDIDISLDRGGFSLALAFSSPARLTALFGRSGAGKSSVIAAIAGLVRPRSGRIGVDGEILFDAAAGIDLPPHRRRVGLVFQDAQLFPHLNVARNLSFGSWFGPGAATALDRDHVVDVLGLGDLLRRDTRSLSGGERQRVAIGRALLARPRLLLMDEPLASLDAPRRQEILPLIERVRDDLKVPIVYVSHAVEEVARLAGEVVVIEAGRLARQGPPEAVLSLHAPPSTEARFQTVSLLTARIESHDARFGLTTLRHPAGAISVPGRAGTPGATTRVLIRGTDVSLAVGRPHGVSIRTVLSGEVRTIVTDPGPLAQLDIALQGGDTLSAFVTRKSIDELGLGEGDTVYAMVKAASISA